MDEITISKIDPISLVRITETVNAWRYYAWAFAEIMLRNEDVKKMQYYLDYISALNKADLELEESIKTDTEAKYQNMKSFIKAMEIVRDTDGFYTFDLLNFPEALKIVENKLKQVFREVEKNRHDMTLILIMDELIEEQNTLRSEYIENKTKEQKSLREKNAVVEVENTCSHDCAEEQHAHI